jgi:hypothetical protein
MGRITTPKYAVEFFEVHTASGPTHWTPMGWNSKQAGRPTPANLAKFIDGYEASTRPGGVNAHIGPTVIGEARIVRNDGSHALVAGYSLATPALNSRIASLKGGH